MSLIPLVALDLTQHWAGYFSLAVFVLAYLSVMGEEFLHLRKSMPVLVAAGAIWVALGIAFAQAGQAHEAARQLRHYLLEFAELFLFLLAAITYINTLEERQVFGALRAWLVRKGLSLRALFWVTGCFAFMLSPIADNLTTALVMGAVVVAFGAGRPKFVAVGCINIVVAANAGGAFSPFGDITTLMVWQKGVVRFHEFFALIAPSIVNWLIPAFLMALSVPRDAKPEPIREHVVMEPGARTITVLFLLTIATTVCLHNFLHLPPALGMMFGLGFLKLYGYLVRRFGGVRWLRRNQEALAEFGEDEPKAGPFDSFKIMQRVEWDTLMFFYGVILCVGALNTAGYLAKVSASLYEGWGPTAANTAVGVISAIVDNIPVMFAVLSMNPDMSHSQWLLVTFTAGVGGSMLSIGSAAGVALMGQARKQYTFASHFKWTWAIALGYFAGIGCHLALNGS
jgi:Na+/H+ antiporter NhaD/arsenite permease-like protein